ncbi:competence protein CoiA [Kitasatospora sp. NPDC056138]|uniref:competence protein CoiA n=1 Tax=Kitasatospora sp. NPDC056138 TaxID=3345724 RepID=UPI0035DB9FB6
MAFTAMHAERGRLDATLDDLGCTWAWTGVHRVRPRAPLTCPECRHGMHAKVSPHGMRFFAHDRGAPTCALAQESMEHHLLKLDLATEVRAAGWFAELEVRAEDGTWRADVMASSPDGSRRMAWEAQLSPITADEIRARTERFAAHGVAVCWVATKARPWVGTVPSVRVTPPGPPARGPQVWEVTAGLARFTVEPCERWCQCTLGHGEWKGAPVPLADFVAWALAGRVRTHRPPEDGRQLHEDRQWWDVHWTAPAYAATAAEHDQAERERLARAEQEERKREATLARVRAAQRARREEVARLASLVREVTAWRNQVPMQRRWKIEDAATRWAVEATGVTGAAIDYHAYDDPRWAGGFPIYAVGQLVALLRPEPRVITWTGLENVAVLTANYPEYALTVDNSPPGTRVINLADRL